MEKMTIPKFENETDEANWAYEHREELAEAFINQHRQRELIPEAALFEALQTKELVITPGELNKGSLVSVLREKLVRP